MQLYNDEAFLARAVEMVNLLWDHNLARTVALEHLGTRCSPTRTRYHYGV